MFLSFPSASILLEKILPLLFLSYFSYTDLRDRSINSYLAYVFLLYSGAIFLISLKGFQEIIRTILILSFLSLLFLKGVIADGDLVISSSIFFITGAAPEFCISLFFSLSVCCLAYAFFLLLKKGIKLPLYLFPFILLFFSLITFLTHSIRLSFLLFLISLYFSIFPYKDKLVEVREILPEELQEGDILVEDIKIGNKIVFKNPGRSLTLLEVKKIKSFGIKNKIKIKWGMPFIPSLLLAFLIYLLDLNLGFIQEVFMRP